MPGKWDVEGHQRERRAPARWPSRVPCPWPCSSPWWTSTLAQIKDHWFAFGKFPGAPRPCSARTGYTGEDGFEVYSPAAKTEWVWKAIHGEPARPRASPPPAWAAATPCAWSAKMALYGHEIDDTTNALEADLGWIIKLQKGDFLGRDALVQVKERASTRKLVGFRMLEKRDIARDRMAVLH